MILVQQISEGDSTLFIAIGALLVLFVIFAAAVGYRLYRFFQQEQIANEKARKAMAAEAAAYAANAFKDQFFSTMSHELRTPLNGMIGFLGLMKMTEDITPEQLHFVDRTRANAERLLLLINDLLDLSKIEAGRMDVCEAPVNLHHLVQKWSTQVDILAKDKHLALKVDVDDQVPAVVLCDEEALTKIGMNLLSNAIKFTEQGTVSLAVKAQNQNMIIEVTDTGIGIPSHMQDVIFESFRQVDGSTRRKYGGTGLGLSIVQRLCRLLGGTIRLNSVVGAGSTFIVTLPLKVPDSASPTAAPTAGAAPISVGTVPEVTQ